MGMRLDDPVRREIHLTQKVFRFPFSVDEEFKSRKIIEYNEYLRGRETEFRLRCKLFGLSFYYAGLVDRQKVDFNYDEKYTQVSIDSYVQCLEEDDDDN